MASLLSGLGNGWSKHAGLQDKHFFLILQIETKRPLYPSSLWGAAARPQRFSCSMCRFSSRDSHGVRNQKVPATSHTDTPVVV